METINKNHKYNFTSLDSVKDLIYSNIFYLIDFKTFNRVNFLESENKNICNNFISLYKDKIQLCQKFNEVYILVDFIFRKG